MHGILQTRAIISRAVPEARIAVTEHGAGILLPQLPSFVEIPLLLLVLGGQEVCLEVALITERSTIPRVALNISIHQKLLVGHGWSSGRVWCRRSRDGL